MPLYIIALAALWFCYEVNTIRPCPPITGLYKRNFGFFYNAFFRAKIKLGGASTMRFSRTATGTRLTG